MKLESEEYPYCQLNETVNMDANSKILSRSLMINLRNEKPEIVYKNYLKLKQLIDGKDKPEKKAKNNPEKEKKQNKKEQKKDNPGTCSKCGAPLVEKSGISSKTGKPYHFYGCSGWPICSFTKPFISNAEKNQPSHEDLMAIYE